MYVGPRCFFGHVRRILLTFADAKRRRNATVSDSVSPPKPERKKKEAYPQKTGLQIDNHFIERSIRRNERMGSHSRPGVRSAVETEFIFQEEAD